MLNRIKRLASRLRRDCGGNATILVALGMPALIGGAGLAVDTAQWYMWQRELQYAADQAAIAGAWSRAKNDSGNAYRARARQELEMNEAIVDFALDPRVTLANYAGGTQNSVLVTTSATRTLPFSSFLTGQGATIAVRAQASFQVGTSYTSCLLAVDDDAVGAITIGGNATLNAGCGMAALSTSNRSVVVNGNPQIDIGYILSAGGIDNWFDVHGDDEVHENLVGLRDPFAGLSPPSDPTPRTYACTTTGSGANRITQASTLPGTYSSFQTACNTTMASGVYVINGGLFTVRAQDALTGNGVMIVLKNGAGIRITGGATINLTAMTASQLIGLGLSGSSANRLAGMLIFEDPASRGNTGNRMNGNASTTLNGTVYLPRSNLSFSGTAQVTSQCLLLAAATITLDGDAMMENFCPAEQSHETVVAITANTVRLVG